MGTATEVARLPDRSSLGPGLRAALFLFRQPWLFWPGIAGTVAWGAFLFGTASARGKLDGNGWATLLAIVPLVGFGTGLMLGMPAWFTLRALRPPKHRFSLASGETLIFEALANHFLGDEGRGGRIHLTNRRIAFVPHRFNIQLGTVDIPLEAAQKVGWGRVVTPTGLPISMQLQVGLETGVEVFVVKQAEELATRIAEACRRQ